MQVQITLRDNIPHSPAIDAHIHEKVDKIQKFYNNITSCQVVIEHSNKKHHQGNLYNTRVIVAVPGKELISTHNDEENLYISIRDAFDDMTRQLESYVEHLQGQIKNHQPILHGKIARLFDADEFGFIVTPDGTEFYFNAYHLTHPSFDKLSVGMPVHFVEEMGNEGPQARRVKVVEK